MHVILHEHKTLYIQYICSNLEGDFILFLRLHTANRNTSGLIFLVPPFSYVKN